MLRPVTLTAALSLFRRRPDFWVGTFAFALVALILATTSISLSSARSMAFNHLTDSFGAGFFAAVVALCTEQLLRLAPLRPARALRFAWLTAVALTTVGLVFTYARPDGSSTNWVLQALLLAMLALSSLVVLVLWAGGLVNRAEVGATLVGIGRHWITIFLYLGFGGYLITTVRYFNPAVIDPVLLRMDVSLGGNAMEIIGPWVASRPWVQAVTNYGYPLLGLFLAATAAALHLRNATAELRRYLLACLLVGLLGKVCYWCAPAIGPIFAFPELVAGSASLEGGQAALDTLRQTAIDGPSRVVLAPGVARNVMPSLHTAFSLIALIAAWSHRRRLFWALLPIGFVQIATTLTFSVHYVVDLFAAVPLTVLCWSLADTAIQRFPPTGTAPLPRLAVSGSARDRRAMALFAALVVALVTLVGWGMAAPLPPWLAWPLVALVVVPPSMLAIRLHQPARPSRAPTVARRTSLRSKPAPKATRLLAFAVFCSGGSALILEKVSEKYLTTLIGVSRPAATIVLAVYFAGLALGALGCPKSTVGAPRRLAALELFTAGWAIFMVTAFFASDRTLGAWLAEHDTSAGALAGARIALAVLWLLPPTLAMGAQLPTLAAVLKGQSTGDADGRSLSRFYTLNLAGAFAFTLIAPPLLFNLVGANGALWAIAALGLFVGIALWFGLPAAQASTAFPTSRATTATRRSTGPLALSFGAGFVFFALEVIWFHLISAVCGASTYSFSILLALVLLSLTLAGRQVTRADPQSLAPVLGALVLVLAMSNAGWPWAGRVMVALQSVLHLEWFWAGEMLKLATIAPLVVPVGFLLGQLFPLLLRNSAADSTQVGRLSAANVAGCVGGALVTGFGLIPRFGAESTLLALTLLVAVGWLATLRPVSGRLLAPGLIGLAALALLPAWNRLELTSGYGVYLTRPNAAAELVSFQEDFRAGFVTVTSTPSSDPTRSAPIRSLLQNGKFDADDAGEVPAQVSFGLIAALHAPTQTRALVIGCGSGQTASVIARLGFKHVDMAELSPAHLAAAREHFGHLNHDLFSQPNVTVHLEDGRNHLLRTRDRFDVIQIELTSVWFAGATNLYSREFYALARERLVPGGVLVQWIQLHHLTPREITTILATARAEFPGVAIWHAGAQACLIGFTAQPRLNAQVWKRWRTAPDLTDERLLPNVDTPAAFLSHEILSAAEVGALLNRYGAFVGINTDRNRWLEFQTPKYYLSRADHRTSNLNWLTTVTTAEDPAP